MHHPFLAQLANLDGRIDLEIRRMRLRYQLSLDEFRGLYVSDSQVDQLLTGTTMFTESPATSVPRPAAGAGAAEARWKRLVTVFDLTPLEEDLLVIATAPEFDPKYEILYSYLNNDVTRQWPTAELARRLLADVASKQQILASLAPAATLKARRILDSIVAPTSRPSLLNGGFSMHPLIAHWLHSLSPALVLRSRSLAWVPSADLPRVDETARQRAEPMLRLLSSTSASAAGLPLVSLLGQAGSGRFAAAAAVAATTNRALVRLDLRATSEDEADRMLDSLTLGLALEPAVVLIEGFSSWAQVEHDRSPCEARIARAAEQWPESTLVVFRTHDDESWRSCLGTRRVVEIHCDIGNFTDRARQWTEAARFHPTGLSDTDVQSLSARFAFTAGLARKTMETARDLATMSGSTVVGIEQVSAAARLLSDRALSRLATKVRCTHDWDDLVLPPPELGRLHELAEAIRHRQIVYGTWGFGEHALANTGVRALFAGGSGTGKTMAAGVIARSLGLELYKVDLSGIVSKYIGETEKNLDRIFRAAGAANAILFLDEAEAILGKRSEVKDAHDRYANIEVAYLLQKLEEHDGVVILATNLRRNIDDAFNRRLQYVIDFPRPSQAEREKIWRRMFPTRAPLGDDVDFGFIARQFDLAGGEIRNVALDAAFLAAQDGGVIGMHAIVGALARQFAKQGKTPTQADFRQYQRLLSNGAGLRNGS